MNKYYIYAHSNLEHGVFYVGKGSNKRLYTTGNRNAYWKRIVKKYGYTALIIEECETEQQSYDREIFWIAHYKSLDQCKANFTLGGDGVKVEKRWWNEKISAALKGKNTAKNVDSGSYKDFATRDELYKKYVLEKLSITKISQEFNVSTTTVWLRLKFFEIPIRDISKRGKAIICTTTGESYKSATEAAKKLNLARENIRKVLYGKYKTTGDLHFKFKD
jgi:hypothetical protein